jgi:DNA polymerase-1
VVIYADQEGYPSISEGLKRLEDADLTVWHNGLGYDYPTLLRLYPDFKLDRENVMDTLILSRLNDPTQRKHSLEFWGEKLGFEKYEFDEFETFTPLMAEYCARDVEVTTKVYDYLKRHIDFCEQSNAIALEHDFAYVMNLQEQHGFRLDVKAAEDLCMELRQRMADIEVKLQESFPPITVERYSEKTGKRLKDGVEVFNPGSRQQIASRLTDKYGFEPKAFTPSGAPKIDETVLSYLDYPEAKLLNDYLFAQKQLSQISEGSAGWLKCVTPDGYVHGKVNTIGTATSRCSHFGPNMGQISKRDLRMREVWKPDVGHKLVGCDADALELRMLASDLGHFDGGEYANALLKGSKDDGTDVHSRTGKVLGLKDRDVVKRVTYAFLYGASNRKLQAIFKDAGVKMDGKEIRSRMEKGITGLDKLTDIIAKRCERGYILGIDGRRVPIISPHSALNFRLQSSGAIVMKKALVVFHFELATAAGHVVDGKPKTFAYCANVHDEVQLSVQPEYAEEIGQMFADAICIAGERLNLKCPVSGSYDIGENWRETH